MVGTKDALGALAYKDKWANIRVASDFAESGSGTLTDPYLNGVVKAFEDLGGETGVIFLDPSFHQIDETIQMVGGQSLVGLAPGWAEIATAVIMLANSSNCDMIQITGTAPKTVFPVIRDIALWGNKNNQSSGCGIKTAGLIDDLYLVRVLIDYQKEHAMYLDSNGKNWIDSCYMEHSDGDGVHIVDGHFIIRNSYIYGGNRGIYADAIDGIIAHNNIRNTTDHGIYLYTGPSIHSLTIDSNWFYVTGNAGSSENAGIRIEDCSNITGINIVNNDIRGPATLNVGIDIRYSDYIYVQGNNIPLTTPIKFTSPIGGSKHCKVLNNPNYNPIGIVSAPFDNTNNAILDISGAASPTNASTVYTISATPCRIISSDSGNADCSIEVKDKDGNSIESGLSTYDGWLEPGWTINWGAFTGTAPTVKVVFK